MPKITVISKGMPARQSGSNITSAAAYVRVSSDSADQLHSYSAQVKYYTDYIDQLPNTQLVDIYAEANFLLRIIFGVAA